MSQILESDDFITSDKYLSNSGMSYKYKKRDFIFQPGKWRGKLILPVWLNPFTNFRFPLVLGHSDYSTGLTELRKLRLFGVRKVYGVNTMNWSNYSEAIPLGLTNDCDDSVAHRIYGNTDHLRIANSLAESAVKFDGKIYVNFTVTNNLEQRRQLLLTLKHCKDVIYNDFEPTPESRIKYLTNLKKYSLVPCPEGNGFDTHRLWETLYMGGTPVIIENNFLPKILDDLPVIKLKLWDEIKNIEILEKCWWQAQKKRNNYNLISFSYWKNKLNFDEAN